MNTKITRLEHPFLFLKRMTLLLFLSSLVHYLPAQVTTVNACAFDEVFSTQNDGVGTFSGVLDAGCTHPVAAGSGQNDCKDATVVRLEVATAGDIDLRITSKETGTCDYKDIDFALFGPYADQAALDAALFPGGTFAWPGSLQIDCGNAKENAKPSFGATNNQEPETPFIAAATMGEWYALILCNGKGFDQDVTIGQAWNSVGSICGLTPADECPTPPQYMGSGTEDVSGNAILGFIGSAASFCAPGPACPVTTTPPGGAVCDAVVDCDVAIDCVTYDEVAPNFGIFATYWGACTLTDAEKEEYLYCPGGLSATDQGYINQLFCDSDGLGYPTIPTAPLAAAAVTAYVSNTTELGNWMGASCLEADEWVKNVPEALQLDYWVFVPCTCSSLGFKITGGSFDAGLVYVGTDVNSMEPVAEYVNVDGVTFYGGATQTGYYTPATACTAADIAGGGRFLRVRQYITDINQQFTVDVQVDVGAGFTNVNSLLAYAATGALDNTPPTVNTNTNISGFQDNNGNVFDASGNYVGSAHNISVVEANCDASSIGCAPLPVELIEFRVRNNEHTNTLTWATASEENNNYFEVERSYEGGGFESISIVQSKETNSIARQDYSEIDIVSKAGTYYYRLKQVDLDGSFSFSGTRTVTVKGFDIGFSIFPNPATSFLELTFNETSIGHDLTDIRIFNANGLLVKTQRVFTANQSVHKIELNDLNPGVYFMELELNYEPLYKKFVIVD